MDPREYSLELSLDGNRFMDHQAAMTPPAAGRRRGGVGRRRSRPTAPDAADPVGLPSEEDIKNRIIVPHLQILGFANDDLKYETQFEITIGTKYRIPRGAKRSETVKAYSDIVCYRLEEPLFVVEVKRGDVELGDEEREQAISYARLLQPKMAPFAIVTNGRDTKVYDAVSGEEVTSLLESGWVKNKYRIAISEELRAEAARTLIGLSPDTVFDLCKAQHELHLGELVGGPNSGRAYSAALFEPRSEIRARFDAFWSSPSRCFAVFGTSGAGKTSVLCWLTQEERERRPVLFYDARALTRSLEETLVADFAWLTGQDRTAEQVVSRLADLAQRHGTEFLVVVDAVDEHRDVALFADELKELVRHVEGRPVRFCIASKLAEWDRFIFSGGAVGQVGDPSRRRDKLTPIPRRRRTRGMGLSHGHRRPS